MATMLIPNRLAVPLDTTERIAEGGNCDRLLEAATETRNWHLVSVLRALQAAARPERRRGRMQAPG